MPLDEPQIPRLTSLIKDSFRIQENHDPVYVDVAGHLDRLASKQHQVVFGRRGSGKSSLFVHYHRTAKPDSVLSIYINADEIKTLPYPDLLIRLIISIAEKLEKRTTPRWRRLFGNRSSSLAGHLASLRKLLDEAPHVRVSQETSGTKDASTELGVTTGPAKLSARDAASITERETREYQTRKLDTLNRYLQDYKKALRESLASSGYDYASILVDDFYLLPPHLQPDVVDYLHRLLRGTDLYLKIGSIRHRTSLLRYQDGQAIGVELRQDVEEINLDQTFENVEATKQYLARMLDSLAEKVGLASLSTTHFNQDGLLALTLASGGVPRDFLTIFYEAIEVSLDRGSKKWLTPTAVYKGASRLSYQTKLRNLREDVSGDSGSLERVFADVTQYCLREKAKTAFLIDQAETAACKDEHELIQQLMDFKLIHVIEPDTSAASGREGRFEAYTLDFAIFMEPRLRGIEHVEFWKVDDQRRRKGLREAPVYPLGRAAKVLTERPSVDSDRLVQELQQEIGIEDTSMSQSDDE